MTHLVTAFAPPPYRDSDATLRLPPPDLNIFQRIIRHPRPESTNPRERECTEALCSVIQNAPSVRHRILSRLSDVASIPFRQDDRAEISIDTELPIGTKRDDLRIEIYRTDDEEKALMTLFSIEVKVGSSFHMSQLQDLPARHANAAERCQPHDMAVSQIMNYDNWLHAQTLRNPKAGIAGFVLAIGDVSAQMPESLKCPWHCITWTDIGKELTALLEEADIPAPDSLLARHHLGFIKTNLWRADDMTTDTQLDFDDIAILRAYGLREGLEERVNALVSPLSTILSDLCEGPVTHQKSLHKPTRRSVVYASLYADQSYPTVMAGICLQSSDVQVPVALSLWLESSTTSPAKAVVRGVTGEVISVLKERDSVWESHNEAGWRDLSALVLLQEILVEDKQLEFIQARMQKWIADLGAVNFVDRLKERLPA